MNAPDKTREMLLAEEATAIRLVTEAESRWLFAQATGTPDEVIAAKDGLDAARRDALTVRKTMQDGLDAWTRYAAWQEAVAHAEANGLAIPTTV